MVLTGTLYPLLLDALEAGKISVGPPYFGLLSPCCWCRSRPAALGFHTRWQEDNLLRVLRELWLPGAFALVAAIATALWLPSAGGWASRRRRCAVDHGASLQHYARRVRTLRGHRRRAPRPA